MRIFPVGRKEAGESNPSKLSFMITAPASGSGKTVVTMTLLSLLKRHGYNPTAFKAGPDYIDPAYHRAVLGIPSHNIDMYLAGKDGAKNVFRRYSAGAGSVVVEGAMGYYDGLISCETECSAYNTAALLNLPVLLVVDARGASYSVNAVIRGLKDFRPDSGIAGVLLNRCSEKLYNNIKPAILRETGVLPVGFLPETEDAAFPSRHLGLVGAEEIEDLQTRIGRLTDLAEKTVSLEALTQAMGAAGRQPDFSVPFTGWESADEKFYKRMRNREGGKTDNPAKANGNDGGKATSATAAKAKPLIAVARDSAFSFIYEENLDVLRDLGADIAFFSPLSDEKLPAGASGLYLPGGYPELYAKELSENASMRASVLGAVRSGMPVIAECGGYSYLQKKLEGKAGSLYDMVGVLPGTVRRQKGLVRFGYAEMKAILPSLLFDEGDCVHVHSFHHYDVVDFDSGVAFALTKPDGRSWMEGIASRTAYCAYPHLYFPGALKAAEKFVEAVEEYAKQVTGSSQ